MPAVSTNPEAFSILSVTGFPLNLTGMHMVDKAQLLCLGCSCGSIENECLAFSSFKVEGSLRDLFRNST